MSRTISVSIIIATFKRDEFLKNTLKGLVNQLSRDDEIIIVNNFPNPATRNLVREFQTKYKITYLSEKKQGSSFARNRGFEESTKTGVVFLDDDRFVDCNWLGTIKKILIHYPGDMVFQAKSDIYFLNKNLLSNWWCFKYQRDWQEIINSLSWKHNPHYVNFLNAGDFFARKSVLKKLPYLFDERLFPFVGEERDLAYRLQLAGIKIVYAYRVKDSHAKNKLSLKAFLQKCFLYGRAEAILKEKYQLKNQNIVSHFAEHLAPSKTGSSVAGYFIPVYLLDQFIFRLGNLCGKFYYRSTKLLI